MFLHLTISNFQSYATDLQPQKSHISNFKPQLKSQSSIDYIIAVGFLRGTVQISNLQSRVTDLKPQTSKISILKFQIQISDDAFRILKFTFQISNLKL